MNIFTKLLIERWAHPLMAMFCLTLMGSGCMPDNSSPVQTEQSVEKQALSGINGVGLSCNGNCCCDAQPGDTVNTTCRGGAGGACAINDFCEVYRPSGKLLKDEWSEGNNEYINIPCYDLPDGGTDGGTDGGSDAGMDAGCEDCDDIVIPGIPITLSGEIPFGQVKCPGIGGTAGGNFSVEIEGTHKPLQCPECQSSTQITGSVSVATNLCNQVSFDTTASGNYGIEKKHCKDCNEETCEYECSDGYCKTEAGGGKLGIGVTKFFGVKSKGDVGIASLDFQCGATVNFNLHGGGGGKVVSDHGYEAECDGQCEECVEKTAGMTVGGSANAVCQLIVEAGPFEERIGCGNCGTLSVSAGFEHLKKSGECGYEQCLSGVFTGALDLDSDCQTIGWGWFSVDVRCKFHLGGTCRVGNCNIPPGGSPCKGDDENGLTCDWC
jgi:hypothetical protein